MEIKPELSIIVPVYNEQRRISLFLKELKSTVKPDWEVIFVDDGSTDLSVELIKKSGIRNVRILSYKNNRGKGYAVKKGVDYARGRYTIFIDADCAVHPSQIGIMQPLLKKYDVVVGTRASKKSRIKQPLLRKITGAAFNNYVNFLYGINIRDNLCGFKGFKSEIAKDLFKNLLSERWVFDVELFYKMRKKNIRLYELPIIWEHKKNSKMRLMDPVIMAFEL